MEECTSLDHRIFLMLIPEHPTVDMAKQFQAEVNTKYRLYKVLPTLHITLESIFVQNEDEVQQVSKALAKICHGLESFTIVVNGFACFGPPYKSVQLHVEKTEPLVKLYNRVHTSLKELGFKVKEYPDGIKFHMTIASTCFAEREWTIDEYSQACEELKSLSVQSGFTLKHLELWYPELEPERRLVACYRLTE